MAEIKHAVQLKLRVNPNQIDNFLRRVHEDFFRGLSEQRGIRRMYLLRGAEDQNNELLLWTLWDSKPAGDAYWASDSGRLAVEGIREILESEPSLTEFAVELHEVNSKDLSLPKRATENICKKSSSGKNTKMKKRARRIASSRGLAVKRRRNKMPHAK